MLTDVCMPVQEYDLPWYPYDLSIYPSEARCQKHDLGVHACSDESHMSMSVLSAAVMKENRCGSGMPQVSL